MQSCSYGLQTRQVKILDNPYVTTLLSLYNRTYEQDINNVPIMPCWQSAAGRVPSLSYQQANHFYRTHNDPELQ